MDIGELAAERAREGDGQLVLIIDEPGLCTACHGKVRYGYYTDQPRCPVRPCAERRSN